MQHASIQKVAWIEVAILSLLVWRLLIK